MGGAAYCLSITQFLEQAHSLAVIMNGIHGDGKLLPHPQS